MRTFRHSLSQVAWNTAFAFVISALAMTAISIQAAHSAEREEAHLKDLENLNELRAQFNADKGSPRLLLLFSPT